MSTKLKIKQTAISVGVIFALMHLIWVIVIAVFQGSSVKSLANIHFIEGISALPFNIGIAIVGVILAFICGLITGAVFAWIWNKLAV